MGAVRRCLLVVRWLLVRRLLVRWLLVRRLLAAGQMELAPFGWRAGSRPGVLLAVAGQMELAPFGSSLWVKRPSPGQAARPDAVAKTGADVTDRPRA